MYPSRRFPTHATVVITSTLLPSEFQPAPLMGLRQAHVKHSRMLSRPQLSHSSTAPRHANALQVKQVPLALPRRCRNVHPMPASSFQNPLDSFLAISNCG
jgi:hypothetical protein